MLSSYQTSAIPKSEENQQRNSSFQQSNPNVTMASAVPVTPATEMTRPQTTNNPANGGVVPESNQQIQVGSTGTEVNSMIVNQSLQGRPLEGDLSQAYGILQTGLSQDETKELPKGIYDSSGAYLEKQVTPYYLSPTTSKTYAKIEDDFSKIRVEGKKANSGVGIDPNFGISLQQTFNVLDSIAGSDAYKIAALQPERNALDMATDAYRQALSSNNPELIQDAAAKLKMTMVPFAEKAKNIEYGKYGARTEFYDIMDNFLSSSTRLQQIYQSDETQLKDFLGQASQAFTRAKVEYKQLKDLPSLNAKKELLDSPVYQEFLKAVVKAVPEVSDKIKGFMSSPIISQDESEFIKKYFVGKYASQLFQARTAALAAFGPIQGSAMFKGLESIIKIKDLPYQTREDDLLDDTDFGQLSYTLNSGSSYQYGQYGGQSYNKGVKTQYVNRTIG